MFPNTFQVKEDEIALRIKLDVQEDIGLLVYDYTIDGHDFGGGVSNADKTMLKRDEELITTWNKEELEMMLEKENVSEQIPFEMSFRIITEYVDPNFENIYPEDITVYLEPIEWAASFGQEYQIHITGGKTAGYSAVLEN